MNQKKGVLLTLLLISLSVTSVSDAFPPQSVEFLAGYKAPDRISDGSPSLGLRYFLSFPSWYFGVGIGAGYIQAKANHQNLAIDSDLKMLPLTLAFRFIPLQGRSLTPYFEFGFDRLSRLDFELDPSVDTGAADTCDTEFFGLCKITTMKKRSYGYHLGAGLETIFKNGLGLGLHYTYLFATPLEKTVRSTPSFGIIPFEVSREDILEIDMSIFSVIVSYHF